MDAQSVMWLKIVTDKGVRCRFVEGWFMIDSYVNSIDDLMLEIDKNKPDVVVIDLDLYEMMDGIETSRKIRTRFDVPVVYV